MLIKRIISILLTIIIFLYASAQSPDDPDCFEKCSRAVSANVMNRVAYFQYPSMNKYNFKYIKLDLAIEANNRTLSGSALIRVTAIQTLDSLIFELKPTMIIDSLFINGAKTTNFSRGSDHVFIPMQPTVSAGTGVEAIFYYHGVASSNGIFAGTVPGNPLVYTASVSESYQAREWFPAKQVLKDKIDSADIWITTSATNLAGSNGLLKAVIDLPNNKKQFQWKTRYPTAYYLLSFAVANYLEYKNYAKPPAIFPDSILIQHFIVKDSPYFNANRANLDKTPAFLENYSEFYGLYPFRFEKYGHSHANIGGGMEHQTMSTMNSFGATLIAHELAHQWFGDNTTCSTWNHIWVNEGFARYSEYLMIDHLPALFPGITSASTMQGWHDNVMSAANGSVYVPESSVFDESRIFNLRLTYNKGAAIIHNLRFEMQNDNLFFQTLRSYLQQYKDSVASADDFRAIAETVSGRSFSDFFNQWYYGEGYPTINIDYSKQGDSIVLFLNQVASAPTVTPFFKGLYEIRIQTLQGDTTVKINWTANDQYFKFKSPRTPTGVVVDPNNYILNKLGSITTGINNPINVSNEVELFPNPSASTSWLRFPEGSFQSLSIVDINGRIIKIIPITTNDNTITLNPSFAPGIYLLRLNGKGKIAIKKMVVTAR